MNFLLEIKNLTRSFGDFIAVDNINLTVETGEIFALLGPNGAGKSTLIKMLTTLLPPTSGDAFIDGFSIKKEPNKVRRKIGYVPQMLSADSSLTGYENLLLFAKLYDISSKEAKRRANESIEFMELQSSAHKLVKTYSGGMIRRLEIAQSMLHQPKILFLDEPTTGLDPIGVKVVWEHILNLKKKYNTTILLTTHIMEEADKLCNRVALLSRGKLVVADTPEKLKNTIGKDNATLEDVFIHYTSETLANESSFRDLMRQRNTENRFA
ncbi:MAG TPA: ATP-binding cassette domain-containing protein [Parafilimonas sp.]|nr:ATP-binding cassette domain-containing protein [Parafilimonas sp.]